MASIKKPLVGVAQLLRKITTKDPPPAIPKVKIESKSSLVKLDQIVVPRKLIASNNNVIIRKTPSTTPSHLRVSVDPHPDQSEISILDPNILKMSETRSSVSETRSSVSETRSSVSETIKSPAPRIIPKLPYLFKPIPPSKSCTTAPTKPKIILTAYCDGSCYNNGSKNASGGIGIYFGPNDPKNVSEPFLEGIPNSQKAELLALTRTIEIINQTIDQDPHHTYECYIHSDSSYAIDSLTKWMPGWLRNNWIGSKGQPIKHVAMQRRLSDVYNLHRRQLKISHIMSHTGKQDRHSLGNEEADKLAKLGSREHPNYKKSIPPTRPYRARID